MVVNVVTGEVVQKMRHDAWGNVEEDTAPGWQPFGYAGGLHEPVTGTVRFGAREYDAKTGRWMQKDPIRFAGGDSNLYAYVQNDPVNLIDPEGQTPIVAGAAIANAIVGGILGGAANYASQRIMGNSISYGDVAIATVFGALGGAGLAAAEGAAAGAGSSLARSVAAGSLTGLFQYEATELSHKRVPSLVGCAQATAFGAVSGFTSGGIGIRASLPNTYWHKGASSIYAPRDVSIVNQNNQEVLWDAWIRPGLAGAVIGQWPAIFSAETGEEVIKKYQTK
jgi:RHS repeat-associated protein